MFSNNFFVTGFTGGVALSDAISLILPAPFRLAKNILMVQDRRPVWKDQNI